MVRIVERELSQMGLMIHLHSCVSSWKMIFSRILGALCESLMLQYSVDSKALFWGVFCLFVFHILTSQKLPVYQFNWKFFFSLLVVYKMPSNDMSYIQWHLLFNEMQF